VVTATGVLLLAGVLLVEGAVPVVAEAGDVTAERARIVAALEADVVADPTIPGEAVAIRAPGLDVTAATGLADVDAGIPLTAETPFRVASMTKTLVAAAVLRLVESHEVRLDAPVSEYLSKRTRRILRADGYRPDRITARQLLRHTSGLFDYATSDEYDAVNVDDPGHHWTRREQLRFATRHGDPLGAPGEVFEYSDTGYVLAGEILERATGESLPDAVRDLLHLRRLGLDHTYWEDLEPTPAGSAPRAHQYYDDYDNITLDASSDLYGGGGLVSTVGDLTRFFRALFHGEVFAKRSTLRTMTKISGAGRDEGAGMGIFTFDVDGERCFGHRGYWGTQTVHCPRLDLTFARTTNQANDDDFDEDPLERVIADLARSSAPS